MFANKFNWLIGLTFLFLDREKRHTKIDGPLWFYVGRKEEQENIDGQFIICKQLTRNRAKNWTSIKFDTRKKEKKTNNRRCFFFLCALTISWILDIRQYTQTRSNGKRPRIEMLTNIYNVYIVLSIFCTW